MANAPIRFLKGNVANLPATYTAGTVYFTLDERAIHMDVSDTQRIRIGDFQEFATLEALKANTTPSTSALYYITDMNCLAKWNGTEYIQINLDTGATSVEVVGDGNAVTAASYDAATRKLTLTMGETFATPDDVDTAIAAKVGEIEGTVKAYVDAKTEGIATDAALGELQEKVTQAESDIDALQEKVGEKTVSDQIDEKIEALDLANTYEAKGEAAKVQGALDEYKESNDAAVKANADAIAAINDETNGILAQAKAYADGKDDAISAAKQAGDDAMEEAQKKVASVTAGDASVTIGGTSTEPTVAAKLSADADNILTLAEDGLKAVAPAAAEYSIVKAAESGDFAAVYNLTKDGEIVGASINIPKDMVVQSGSVVELAADEIEGYAAGTYIKLVLQNVEEPLYINVGSLIEYVTSGSAADDMVVIAVSDDHKVTATITDGSITLAKLNTEIQTAIGKAHIHENADVLSGVTADKVAAWDDAAEKAHEHANADELAKIADGDVEKWNAAQANAEATAAAALAEAKTELEGKITAENERAVAAEAQALTDAKAYADGLAVNYDAAGSAATAEENAKAYADSLVLVWGSF